MDATSLPRARDEAREVGAKRFFTGIPCNRGHVAPRYTLDARCVECDRDSRRRASVRERVRERARTAERREHNRERIRKKLRDPELQERKRELDREYYHRKQQKPEGRAANTARMRARRALKTNATPAWLTAEQKLACRMVYEEAARLTEVTGVAHHVDHSVPLKCRDRTNGNLNACGLHAPWNLRAIPGRENQSKNCYADLRAIDDEIFAELLASGLATSHQKGEPPCAST